MDDTASYPPIDPTNFDLIVVGTGLPESIIAAAASATGKTVLHLDPNPSYGGHFASLPLHDFTAFLQSHSKSVSLSPPTTTTTQTHVDSSSEFSFVPLSTRPVYSSVEIMSNSSEVLDNSRKFCLDLAGPRVFFCADEMIDLILRTDINQYMEFKSVDGSFIYEAGEGGLRSVPDSRSAIFKDKGLTFPEKNQLMRFFKMVQGHFGNDGYEGSNKFSEEDLESPFVEFLSTKIGLSKKLTSIVLYAIVMADSHQERKEDCKDVILTKDGLNRLILYHSSVGRFPNASGAMIYPIYGQGELPQAFCRRAAVKGCIYVLRMPVLGLLLDKDTGHHCVGVRLGSGQELVCHKVIFAPSFIPQSRVACPSSTLEDGLSNVSLQSSKEEEVVVARAICITKSSLKPDAANCLVFYPPQSLCPEQLMPVRVLQLSSNVAVCPSGMFVVYLSAMCSDAEHGKKSIHAAMEALFSVHVCKNEENSMDTENEYNAGTDSKPALLWSVVYMQDLTLAEPDFGHSTPMPDGNLHYSFLLEATKTLFTNVYPNEDFLPNNNNSTDEAMNDDDVSEAEDL